MILILCIVVICISYKREGEMKVRQCLKRSHLRVDLGHDADAVVVTDGEVVVKHPAGGAWLRSAAVI